MKSAKQIREFVRRLWLREMAIQIKYKDDPDAFWPRSYAKAREGTLLEVLNAFDTPHKTKLKMPGIPRRYSPNS